MIGRVKRFQYYKKRKLSDLQNSCPNQHFFQHALCFVLYFWFILQTVKKEGKFSLSRSSRVHNQIKTKNHFYTLTTLWYKTSMENPSRTVLAGWLGTVRGRIRIDSKISFFKKSFGYFNHQK